MKRAANCISFARILFAALAAMFFTLSLAAAPVRLAILTGSESIQTAADLLSASFSKQPNVELFERDKIQTILRERSLQTARLTESIGAFRAAGADALLFVEPARIGTNNGVALRLVAAKPGAVLLATHALWPVEDTDKWVESITAQFAAPLARVAVPDDRLVRISLLNFRSPSSSPSAQLLDRELTTLIRLRLAREPEFLVLERQDMQALGLEKDLAASTEQFWTGSYLLEGSVNRDASTLKTVTLDLQLTAPGAAAQNIHLEGPRNDLPALANSLAADLLKRIHRASAASWNPANEAKAYLEEARWGTRWQMWPESISAADSAWSLGLQDLDSATVRLLAYARGSHQYSWKWNRMSFNYQEFDWPAAVPEPAKLTTLNEALNFVLEMLTRYPNAVADQPSYLAICETMFLTGDLLHNYYYRAEAREGHEEQLAEIRRLAREICAKVMNHPDVRQNHTDPQDARVSTFDQLRNDIFVIDALYAVFFNETPEDTAAAYRDLVKNHWSKRFEKIFEDRHIDFAPLPLFGGWKWNDRKRAQDVLEKFATEMRSSPIGFTLRKHAGNEFKPENVALSAEQQKAEEETVKWMTARRNRGLNRTNRTTNGPRPFLTPRERMLALSSNRSPAAKITNLPPEILTAFQPQPEPKVLLSRRLTEADFWVMPIEKIEHPNVARGFMQWPIVRNGALWFRFYYTYYVDGPFLNSPSYADCLVSLDLKTLTPKFIPLDLPEFKHGFYFSRDDRPARESFEITSNAIYVVHFEKIFTRPVDRPAWSSFPLATTQPQIYLIHDRLYLSAADSIQDFSPNGALKTLASVRRRPAKSPLDNLETLDWPVLLPAPHDAVRVLLKTRQFILEKSGDAREEFDGPSRTGRSGWRVPFYVVPGAANGSALLWTPQTGAPQILARTANFNDPAPVAAGPKFLLNYGQIVNGLPFVEGETPGFLLMAAPSMFFALKQSAPCDLILFPTNAPLPIHIPLDLPKQKVPGLDHMPMFMAPSFFVDSPRDLFLGNPDLPGLWRIPKDQIEQRIRETLDAYNHTNQPSATK